VFGLHPNAEITYFSNYAKRLWENILAMQISETTKGTTINRE